MFNPISMELDLGFKFVTIFEESEGMIVSLADELNLTSSDHTADLFDKFGTPLFSLIEPGTSNAKGDFKVRIGPNVVFK